MDVTEEFLRLGGRTYREVITFFGELDDLNIEFDLDSAKQEGKKIAKMEFFVDFIELLMAISC